MSKQIPGMTQKQSEAFNKANSELPAGWAYTLCRDDEKSIWGVNLIAPSGNNVGMVHEPVSDKIFNADADQDVDQILVRSLINRVALALWSREPEWLDALNE